MTSQMDSMLYTKLNKTKHNIYIWKSPVKIRGKYEEIFTRLRIGHIKIFHSHLMFKEKPRSAIYPAREVQLTTKDILTECRV